jgi:hypothetical protein
LRTPDAAFETDLRVGSESFLAAFLREEARFGARLGALFFAVVLRAALFFRAGPLLLAALFFPALFLAGPRLDDLRAEDFRTLLRPTVFFLPFEPPRDDFLAAAMIRAPI